ncbi:MAG TPA: molybdopterin molybdotransferase MoeA, partial [Bacteroidia bacterium]|nr:molybdopterin molybdotransferase MoeA [Bacteroidia bacterium]
MITVEEAKQLLFNQVQKSESVEVNITEAFGCVLSEDIFSPFDLPLFNQSSMDGYAVAGNDTVNHKQFELIGEIKAGDNASITLLPGQAVRIFTGAAVPSSADAVVIQEKVERRNGSIFLSEDFNKGAFIRLKGSQIRRGEIALKKDSVLNPASVGFLASLGVAKVKIYRKPVVSILVTGDEIVLPGNNLQPGQVYESNSFSLHAALQQMHIQPKNILRSPDNKNELKARIEKCLADSDIT